jgi:hypothetical protein
MNMTTAFLISIPLIYIAEQLLLNSKTKTIFNDFSATDRKKFMSKYSWLYILAIIIFIVALFVFRNSDMGYYQNIGDGSSVYVNDNIWYSTFIKNLGWTELELTSLFNIIHILGYYIAIVLINIYLTINCYCEIKIGEKEGDEKKIKKAKTDLIFQRVIHLVLFFGFFIFLFNM